MIESLLSVLLSWNLAPGPLEAWDRAEAARRSCCPGQATCVAPIPDVERCYLTQSETIFSDYRQAFEQSQATDLDALRRCEEVATRIIEQWGQRIGQPPCAVDGDIDRACAAKFAADGCDRRKIALSALLWWQPLQAGADLVDAGQHTEGRARLAEAYDLYLTSTGPQGQFREAWFILRESIRSQQSGCGTGCAAGELRLGEQLAALDRLFERFHEGCHASADLEVRQVCERRDAMRGEHAITLVRADGLYLEAADLLESAYRDCSGLVGLVDPRRSERVLHCWRTFGRRAAWLRTEDAGAGRASPQQLQKARTLVNEFVRDLKRECDSTTRQVEVGDACDFLRVSERPGGAERTGEPPRLAMPVVLAPLALSLQGEGPEGVLSAPLFDVLLAPAGATPTEAGKYLPEVERRMGPREAAGLDCGHIASDAAADVCAVARILSGTREVLRSTVSRSDAGVVHDKAVVREVEVCRRCRSGAIAAFSIGAIGGAMAVVGAAIGASAEARQHTSAMTGTLQRADELRVTREFELGEAMNRLAVSGLVAASVGVVVGAAVLVADAAGRRKRRTQLKASAGGLLVRF